MLASTSAYLQVSRALWKGLTGTMADVAVMGLRLLGIAFVAFLATVVALDRYSAAGLQIARDECRRQGILRIYDRELWQTLVKHAEERRRLTKTSRDIQPDGRFDRTIYQLHLDGKLVAELHLLRFTPVSVSSKLGLPHRLNVYICAWDERRDQFMALAPLFT